MNTKLKQLLGLNKPKQLIAWLAFFTCVHVAFPRYIIATESMEPTISAGDYVVASRLHLLFSTPQTGQIVVISPSDGISSRPWVHRLIGGEGTDIGPLSAKLSPVARRDVYLASGVSKGSPDVVPAGYYYQSGDGIDSYHGLIPADMVNAVVIFHFALPWRDSKK
jgi:signal peptidase I